MRTFNRCEGKVLSDTLANISVVRTGSGGGILETANDDDDGRRLKLKLFRGGVRSSSSAVVRDRDDVAVFVFCGTLLLLRLVVFDGGSDELHPDATAGRRS